MILRIAATAMVNITTIAISIAAKNAWPVVIGGVATLYIWDNEGWCK